MAIGGFNHFTNNCFWVITRINYTCAELDKFKYIANYGDSADNSIYYKYFNVLLYWCSWTKNAR